MDGELRLPRATLDKLIKEFLPADIGCVKETRQVLMNCCIEFIHLVTSEANETCEKQGKKTINGEHIIAALQELGFEEFVNQVQETFEEFKNQNKSVWKKPKQNLPDESLLEEQQRLFQQSKDKMGHAVNSPVAQDSVDVEQDEEMDED
eukprot:NODE_135_length_18075_cov_0.518413.p10 type:complete len:149 gc:universal NODE_135_length_18075_cov_0.518413:10999-11445(+)